MRSRVLLSLLLFVTVINVNGQTVGSRLIHLTNRLMVGTAFVATDSTDYRYHSLRTSNMKTGVYNYDSALTYAYSSSSYHNYQLNTKGFWPWDSVSQFSQYYWDTSGTWVIDLSVHNTFDMTSHLIQHRDVQHSGTPVFGLDYFYDGSNNLITILKRLPPPALDSIDQILYTYNSSNYLISVVTQVYTPVPTPGFVNVSQTEYFYNALNEDTAKITKTWSPPLGPWLLDNIVKYSYDASKRNNATYYIQFNASLGGLVPTGRDTVIYDDSSNVVNITKQIYDTAAHNYVNNSQFIYTYNTPWNNPVLMTSFSWTGSAWASLSGQDNQTQYYYEDFVHVPKTTQTVSSFDLFPTPTQNLLNIRMKWSEPEAFTVGIYDMEGRLYKQFGESAMINYQKTISVSDLPPGNYFIQIRGKNTFLTEKFTIAK